MEQIKEQNHYELTLAGATVGCSFEFPETHLYFGNYINGPFPGEGLRLSPEDRAAWERTVAPMDAFNEYSAFTVPVSEALLKHGRCVMHAAAFRFHDRAYLIAARSGVGKSTQVKTLSELYPGEFTVISGDRPVLEATEYGVMVHPSPWNGKEGWCGAEKAPLAAMILLRRGEVNSLERFPAGRAAAPVFSSLFQSAENGESIRRTASFADLIIKSVPVWAFENGGVPDSSRMLYETVLKEAEEHGV